MFSRVYKNISNNTFRRSPAILGLCWWPGLFTSIASISWTRQQRLQFLDAQRRVHRAEFREPGDNDCNFWILERGCTVQKCNGSSRLQRLPSEKNYYSRNFRTKTKNIRRHGKNFKSFRPEAVNAGTQSRYYYSRGSQYFRNRYCTNL